MPTQRFLHLPPAKQQRILGAARQELCRVPAEQMSINKIVQAAQIPRGSFYQYFEDKADLLRTLLCGYAAAARARLCAAIAAGQTDVFALTLAVFDDICDSADETQDTAALFKNLFSGLKLCSSDLFETLRPAAATAWVDEIAPLLHAERHRLPPETSFEELLELLGLLLRSALARLYAGRCAPGQARQTLANQLRILQQGVHTKEKTHNV